MFDNLSQRLQATLKRLRGRGRLTEGNTAETLREVRLALLEADVALPAVKAFVEHVRGRAAGREVLAALTPGQAPRQAGHRALSPPPATEQWQKLAAQVGFESFPSTPDQKPVAIALPALAEARRRLIDVVI